MGNLGLARVAELLVAMFDSGAWRDFSDGNGRYQFLPGEFDYFLTQQGVTREQVLHGVRDIEVKARLEETMDERRTGEDGYRRRLSDVRQAVPARPGRPIEPFGYTMAEAAYVRETDGVEIHGRREALGRAPRQWRASGGASTKRPSERLSRIERVVRDIDRLSDKELGEVERAIMAARKSRSTVAAAR
jgi:hypothetical protein